VGRRRCRKGDPVGGATPLIRSVTTPAYPRVSIESYGLGLVWVSRFEVHIDQIIGLATRIEPIERRIPNAGAPGG
jgi:hypothetical protein